MTDTAKIHLLTVDDHELLRRGIRFSLLATNDIEVVGEADSGEAALRLCEELRPDVMLMDMHLPGESDGIAAIQSIHSNCPKVKILALSSFYDRDLVQGAMQAGAIGYLVKGISGEELANAIRAAHVGQTTLTPKAVAALVQPVASKPRLGNDLTERELEVLALLVEGRSNAEIAERLFVTVAAVKYHVGNILSKLEASNRTEAATLAIDYKLVPPKRT